MASPAPTPLRALRYLGLAVAALLALIVVLSILLVVFVRGQVLESQVRQRVLPVVSERLGREVSFEDVEGYVLPSPHVRVRGLRVAGRTDTPLFVAETVEARLRVWPLLMSRGKKMVLSQLRFESPQANLVRLPSGEWDLPRPPPSKRRIEVDLEDVVLDRGRLQWVERGDPVFTVEDLTARASFVDSALAFRTLRGRAYGATFDGDGSRIDLAADPLRWNLDASVEDIVLESLPLRADPLRGELATSLALEGEDLASTRMMRSASGTAAVRARDLIWRSLDLTGAITQSLAGLLEGAGLPIARPPSPGETVLGSWERNLTVRDGWVEFEEPLEFDAPVGETRIGGRWSLDARLDLEAQTGLEAEYVRTLTRGELEPDAPVPIRYRIRGNVSRPRVEQVDASAFLPLLAEEGAKRLREGLEKLIPPFGTGTTEP